MFCPNRIFSVVLSDIFNVDSVHLSYQLYYLFFSERGKVKKTGKKGSKEKKMEAESLAEQAALLAQQPSAFEPPTDSKLEDYVSDVMTNIAPLTTTREQVIEMAKYVSYHPRTWWWQVPISSKLSKYTRSVIIAPSSQV